MRVLILANSTGGLINFRRELIERLLTEGYEVYADLPEDKRNYELVSLGVVVVPCNSMARHGTNPLTDVRLYGHYLRVVYDLKPDIVFTYTIKPNVYGGMACARLRVPYVANVTGLGNAIENGGVLQSLTLCLYRHGLRKARKVFFQNSANRGFMLSHRVVKRPNDLLPGSGVNTDKFALAKYPSGDTQLRFISVGRIMRDKGIGELLGAASAIKKRYPNVKFRLLGSFDESWEVEVSKAVLDGIVEHIPQQPDVRPYVAECHAIVHPSWHEGMSNVCLEAASMGRPVIASDIPGCRETFEDGVTGIGFEPKDADSLVKALERFIELPYEEKKQMGLAGREKVVREFDRQIVINKYLEEISAIAKE